MPGAMLRHRSSKGLRLPGISGNYASTPDSVLNSITGDIDIRVCVKLDDWTPAVQGTFIAKNVGDPNRSYRFTILTNGSLQWESWPTGIVAGGTLTQSSSIAASTVFADGAIGWVRVTLDVDNGAGGNDVRFYTSIDGLVWNPLGVIRTSTGVTNLTDGTSPIEIGSNFSGTVQPLVGTVYYAEVRNGIDGPIVTRFDGSQVQTTGSQLPASINGWTWGGTTLYKRDDYVRLPGTVTNYLSFPDTVADSLTGDIDIRCHLSLDNWSAASQCVVGKWDAPANQRSYLMRVDANTITLFISSTGSDTIAVGASAALSFANGSVGWIRVTRVQSTGVSTWQTSPDGVTWTVLTTSSPVSAGIAIFDSTALLQVGAQNSGGSANPVAGNIYYAEVRNGINGPVVAYWNGADNMIQTPWTINGAAWNWEASNFSGKPGIAYSAPLISGNYISTPDNNALDITAAIDIRAKVSLTNWADGVNFQGIVSKRAVGGQDAYQLRIDPTGELTLVIFSGGANVGVPSTVPTGFTAGSIHWVRGTYIADNGAVGHTENYFTSDDGVTWTPLGTPRVNAVVKPIDATTAALTLTTGDSGTVQLMKGNLYYAEVRNGIDGPIVAKFDATNIAKQNRATNIISSNDSSFETSVAGYVAYPGGTTHSSIARSTTQALDGAASLAMTSLDGTTGVAAAMNASTGYTIVPNRGYVMKASFRADTTPRQFIVIIDWYVSSVGAYISSSISSAVSDTNSGWTEIVVTGTAPGTATFTELRFQSTGVLPTGEIHYADRVLFFEQGQPTTTIQPGGTPNMLTPNQASIETDNSGWSVRANCTAPQSAVQALDGTKSLAITSVAAGDMSAFTLPGGVATAGISVIPGKLYTAIVNTRADTTIRQFSSFIQWFNAAGSNLSTSFSIVPINNSTVGWTSNFVTVVAPAGAAFAAAGAFILATGAAAEVHYVDRVSLVEAAEPWTINGTQWDWVNTPETTISVGGGSRILIEV